MTPEKREAAIAWLKDEIRSLRLAPKINGCGPELWADQLEIMETCLEAVRLTNTSTDRSIEPLTLDKDIYFPIPDTRNMEPLTLEQYNALDWRPVIVEKNTMKKWWEIAHSLSSDTHGYGRFRWAYSYPPAHIKREAWKECESCETCVSCQNSLVPYGENPCRECSFRERKCYEPRRFCPECGRPLTEEAWAMLEKRLRGCKE